MLERGWVDGGYQVWASTVSGHITSLIHGLPWSYVLSRLWEALVPDTGVPVCGMAPSKEQCGEETGGQLGGGF